MDTAITLRHLLHAVMLAEELSFRRAAQRAHLSQTAFSRSIQVAEERLGLRLFDRDTRSVRVTPAGAQLIDSARALLTQATDLARQADGIAQAEGSSLAMGATLMAIDGVLGGVLPRFRATRPQLHLTVEVGHWQSMRRLLEQERIEFYVGYPGPPDTLAEVEVLPLPPQPTSVFCRAGHPVLSAGTAISPQQLTRYPWAMVQLPDALADKLRALFKVPPGTPLPQRLSCDNQPILREAVLSSDTLLMTWRSWLQPDLDSGQVVDLAPLLRPRLPPQALLLECGIVRLPGRTPSPAAARLMEMVLGEG